MLALLFVTAAAAIDRVILVGLLGTAAAAIFAPFTRAAGRRYAGV